MYRAEVKSLPDGVQSFQYMSVNMIWEMFESLLYKRLKRGLKEDIFLF